MRLPKLRTVVGVVLLGLFVVAWLNLADTVATSTCDDACSSRTGWSRDPDADRWTTQLWLARAGATLAAVAAALWCWRRRTLSLIVAAVAATLLVLWWPLAQEGRFGPPRIGAAPNVWLGSQD